ncbi:hypothetical protein CHCC14809_2569 [Bacillus licheniformis]|nr:hypothetical protein CHCC14600_0177 [Bacillus licheniformis]TWM83936.1 hypothetical protein CHCC14809_2569 [Bacillus licheniformis]TWM93480.1 hypothetical protein CHCC14596_0608 [Bacillus licheniformis]TWN36990.1 hypothetical protein CHCC14525_4035 [Bacillus licheniformis]TWN51091.1 hypothetical protein CHCC14435_2685 [Bacillus licheniformis]
MAVPPKNLAEKNPECENWLVTDVFTPTQGEKAPVSKPPFITAF